MSEASTRDAPSRPAFCAGELPRAALASAAFSLLLRLEAIQPHILFGYIQLEITSLYFSKDARKTVIRRNQ